MRKQHAAIATLLLLLTFVEAALPVFAIDLDDPRLGLPPVPNVPESSASAARAELGRLLFFDKGLSADGTVSCASCHQPERAYSDGKTLAIGVHGKTGTRNTPSIINAAYNTFQFWDGRRDSLEQQAIDPLTNPREHGLKDAQSLLQSIRRNKRYFAAFRAAFGVESKFIDTKMVSDALAGFERKSLIAGGSPFDRYYYGGEKTAMTKAAIRGLDLFKNAGQCSSCHSIGPTYSLFTDDTFHGFGIKVGHSGRDLATLTSRIVSARGKNANLDQETLSEADVAALGRFVVTLKPSDIGRFKTPSLRNVALTAPYMHDGSVPTLQEAIDQEIYYRSNELGRPLILTPSEKADLVEFLNSLNGRAIALSPGS